MTESTKRSGCAAPARRSSEHSRERNELIDHLEIKLESVLGPTRNKSAAVFSAMRRVPRHAFVPPKLQKSAYIDSPLPIGQGQTISQPFIVALMTCLLEVVPGSKILEVGTGSGFQAAILAEMGAQVFGIECIPALAESAHHTLAALGYDKVTVKLGNGRMGWPEHAPYQGIIITAAAEEVPDPLIEQLATGGRLVAPLGPPRAGQMLTVLTKDESGHLTQRDILPVAFVPLTGEG